MFRNNSEEALLDMKAIEEIFSTTRNGVPFDIEKTTDFHEGKLTLSGWIGLWQSFFFNDYQNAYINLVYIGYCGTFRESIAVQK